MDFEIRSFIGAGPIKFGMSRAEVSQAVHTTGRRFRRTDEDEADCDEFGSLGIFVEYDKLDHCISVEISKPSRAIFMGRSLLDQPYVATAKWLKDLDGNLEIDEAGLDSHKFGIGLYADIPKRDKISPAESVIAFCRTYYD